MPNLPDYRLKVKDKTTERSNHVGAAWLNENGSISIRLDLCVVLREDPNLLITLFPETERPKKRKGKGKKNGTRAQTQAEDAGPGDRERPDGGVPQEHAGA